MQPAVSVIIPSFNRESLITETLDSLVKQTFQAWEAIVVDDGSTDRTCPIVQSYAEKDVRIKLLQRNRQPKGASVCRNIGIEHAKGKYIIFLDSDDLLMPHCLEARVRFMEAHPELHFAVFQMMGLNEKGPVENVLLLQKKDNYLYAYLRHDLPWHTTCPIWNISFVKNELQGFNEKYPRLQDPEFNTRALMVKHVKYEVLAASAADSYNRFHTDKVFNVSILLTGFKLYIEEFSERIRKLLDYKACKQQLRQSYIEALRGFYSYYKPEHHNDSIRLVEEMERFAYKDGLISLKMHFLTGFLIQGYKSGLTKSALGRKILRGLMKLIKMS